MLWRAVYLALGGLKPIRKWMILRGMRGCYTAIKDEKLSVMQLLIEMGADVNYRVSGSSRSPLHTAALRNDPKFTRVLLQNGTDVIFRDNHWQTPLRQAALNDFREAVDALLHGGSDLNSRRGKIRSL